MTAEYTMSLSDIAVSCVHDPTDTYNGAVFDYKNFIYTAFLHYWPEGARFEMVYPKERTIEIRDGCAVDVVTGEVLHGYLGCSAKWRRQ